MDKCKTLNLSEILWRFIKYKWLPVSAYISFKTFTYMQSLSLFFYFALQFA